MTAPGADAFRRSASPTSAAPIHRHLWLGMAACLLGSAHADEIAWQFDPSLLQGSGLNAELAERFNRPHALLPGVYQVALYANSQFIGRLELHFIENAQAQFQPCVDAALWRRVGVAEEHIQKLTTACPALAEQVAGSQFQFDPVQMRLLLSIPQNLMQRERTGVDIDTLDAGRPLLFFNYMGNGWHAERDGRMWARHQDTGYLSLNGGINFGRWQYRQQGSLSLSNRRSPHWRNLRSYLQRPLPRFMGGSQLSLGQLYSGGHFFSGLAYHGLALANDERLLGERQRGFAPEVRGVAGSTAKVSVRQKGREIYQTTVAPGAFVIDDLSPTHHEGELEVIVEEADGTVRTFKVPFSALPEALRPGHSRYHLAFGRTRGTPGGNSEFADLDYRRGVSNLISAGIGLRVAAGYQALAGDAVYLNRVGAIGLTLSHSRASMPGGHTHAGWRAGLSYSRTFTPTQTHLAIAAYRYSTAGYRDLGDVLGERASRKNGAEWATPDIRQRSRLDLNLGQRLGEYGSLYVSGSSQNWHRSHQHERQWQLGYNTQWKRASVNLSLMRQHTASVHWSGAAPRRETLLNLSISMPLGDASFSSGYSHGRDGGPQYDADVSGGFNQTRYHLGVSHAQHDDVWHASLQQRLPSANLGINASLGAHHWQMAGNVQGALALHGGGVTFGPWLGDTFALVEAKGATGARVGGSGQARIDRFGYALVSALTPYRDNRIFLDPQDAAGALELEDAEQHTTPYAGAAVKLTFRARRGLALLIHVEAPDRQLLPPGTEALDADGNAVGMLGQSNWLYLRSETTRGQLQLHWDEGEHRHCRLFYDASAMPQAPLVRLEARCIADQDLWHAGRKHPDPPASTGAQQ